MYVLKPQYSATFNLECVVKAVRHWAIRTGGDCDDGLNCAWDRVARWPYCQDVIFDQQSWALFDYETSQLRAVEKRTEATRRRIEKEVAFWGRRTSKYLPKSW